MLKCSYKMAETTQKQQAPEMYQGMNTKEIFNIYNEIKGKEPGLQEKVMKYIKANPNLAYDHILSAYEKYKPKPSIFGGIKGAISGLETAIADTFFGIVKGVDDLIGGFYNSDSYSAAKPKPKAEVTPLPKNEPYQAHKPTPTPVAKAPAPKEQTLPKAA